MKMRALYWIIAAGFAGSSLLSGCQQGDDSSVETIATIEAPLVGADAPNAIPGQYIVVFKDSIGTSSISSAMNRVANFRDSSKVQHTYSVIPGFSAALSPQALAELRRNPDVAYIEQDQIMHAFANANGQDRVDQDVGRDGAAYNSYGNNGSGVHVYIVDTGSLTSHSEFTGRVGNGIDKVDNDNDPTDCQGHGTHVSGTVLGTTYGLAKQATLHAVRVLNCQGSGTNAGVIAGVDWVRTNHVKPAVANMSLGGGASTTLDNAVANAVTAGVTFAVAAGNDNANACNYSPARVASAITVGALEDTSDARASFSNFGNCVDIFAPGRNIKSSWIGGNTATNTISGTSMATPHVAGVVAQYLGTNPTATPAQVLAALQASSTINCVTSPGSGSPNVILQNKFDGVKYDCGGGNPPPPPPPNDPNSCQANNACGGGAPGGCFCDVWCIFFGDCCSDGPC